MGIIRFVFSTWKKHTGEKPKKRLPQSFSKVGIIRFVQQGDTVKGKGVATGGKYKIQDDDYDDIDDYDDDVCAAGWHH